MAGVRPAAVARVTGWALACALTLASSGCGTGAMPYPPTGLDELVIPTPRPAPSDFVDRIDNVWLPLAAGRTWVYDVKRTGHPEGVRTVSVLSAPVVVAGVGTTAVRTTLERPGASSSSWTDYYAQDTRGNVWWFGREGLWQAGRDGAEAGLVITATPRLGDGYRAAYEKGVVEDVVTVAQATPVVSLQWTTALAPGSAAWDTYRKGIGLVDRLDSSTGERDTLRE